MNRAWLFLILLFAFGLHLYWSVQTNSFEGLFAWVVLLGAGFLSQKRSDRYVEKLQKELDEKKL